MMLNSDLNSLQQLIEDNNKIGALVVFIINYYVLYVVLSHYMENNMIAGIDTKLIIISLLTILTYQYPSTGILVSIVFLAYLIMNNKNNSEHSVLSDDNLSHEDKQIINDSMTKASILTNMVKKASESGNHELATALTNEVAKQDIKIESVTKAAQLRKTAKEIAESGDLNTAQQYQNEATKHELKVTSLINSEALRSQAHQSAEEGNKEVAIQLTKAAENEETKVKLIIHADNSLTKAIKANEEGNHEEAQAHLNNVTQINDMLVQITNGVTPSAVATTGVPTTSAVSTTGVPMTSAVSTTGVPMTSAVSTTGVPITSAVSTTEVPFTLSTGISRAPIKSIDANTIAPELTGYPGTCSDAGHILAGSSSADNISGFTSYNDEWASV
jgi:hypothetical protein